LFLQAARLSAATATRIKARIGKAPESVKKEEAAGKYRQPLEKPTPP
jgi:hypothetical protein